MTTVLLYLIFCAVITNKYTKKESYLIRQIMKERGESSNIDREEKFKDNVNDQWEIIKTVLNLLEDKYVPQKEVSNYRKRNFPLKYLEYCRNKIEL